MKPVYKLVYKVRWFLLGFGLAGLHHEDLLLNFTSVAITAVAIALIVSKEEV